MKIRHKLTLLFGTIVAAILLLFCFAIFYFYSLLREIEFYERLKDKAEETAELLLEVKKIDQEILQIIDKHDITTLFKEEVIMYDSTHALIYKSGEENIHFPDALLDDIGKKKEIRYRKDDRETVGILVLKGGKKYIVIASAIDKYGYNKRDNLILILLIGGLLCTLIVFIAGRYFSANALEPISEVVKQVDKILPQI